MTAPHTPTTPDVPAPAGAVDVEDWRGSFRTFEGSSWEVPPYDDGSLGWRTIGQETRVWIQGVQRSDASIKREIFVSGFTNPLTLERAGQLADALRAACDEAERMNHLDA